MDMADNRRRLACVSAVMASPVGALTLVASEAGLAAILWENDDPRRVPIGGVGRDAAHPVLIETERQLGEYFTRRRRIFDLPLAFEGTDFQKRVWAELLRIPFGETRSYGQIARSLGDPNLMRAVGGANGRNPISIIAPCHRVVGASGQLTGFAGGLAAKAYLLALERPAADLFGGISPSLRDRSSPFTGPAPRSPESPPQRPGHSPTMR